MRFTTFTTAELAPTWGAVDGDDVVVLGPGGADVATSLADAITAGTLPADAAALPAGAPRVALADVTYLPVIPAPGKIICVGVNYEAHAKEAGRERPPAPTLFIRTIESQIGARADAIYPTESSKFDYEGELAVIIGTQAYRVGTENALDHVAGYAPYNDFTARDWQRATPQWTAGKNFVGTGGFGPTMVTPDEVPNLLESTLTTRVNGDVRQQAKIAQLTFDIPELIAHISTVTPLNPGDVIVSGTPGGVGFFMEPQGLLEDGDVVEVEIEGVGVLTNTVRQRVAELPSWL
ncbi:fumarylacetoacetate hydrolase family protein [Georgenia sp. Z1491]|uniref:fumarylacetoacetate hydrolase family protein n=1 Tax=Georgenia sp. Z1491 TaxID=3416707 RepID=UPI003CF6EBB6